MFTGITLLKLNSPSLLPNADLSIFLVASTCFLLLIGAGLLSKAVGYFETYKYVQLVGADVAETGTGPGSYNVHGNVWQ